MATNSDMIKDCETNTIVVADRLVARHPDVFHVIAGACKENNLKLRVVESVNIWTRDFMPIQCRSGMVKFRYGYASDNPTQRNLRINSKSWQWLGRILKSDLRLDGGNVIGDTGRAIMTDTVFRHNREVKRLIPRLESVLDVKITVIPTEPDDDIGHADGICKFTPSGKLLVHDYRKVGTDIYKAYHDKLMNNLADFEVVLFPIAYSQRPELTEKQFRSFYPSGDTFNPAYGYYLNMLVVGKAVLLPQFNIPDDEAAMKLVKENFKGHKIYPVYCTHLAMEGGLANCVTMTYRL